MASKVNRTSKENAEVELEYIGINDVKKGNYILLRNMFPCRVTEISKSAPGKHGAAKLRVLGVDIFTSKKYDDLFNSSALVTAPVVTKHDYRLLMILDENFVKLQSISNPSIVRDDIRLDEDEDVHIQIEKDFLADKKIIVQVIGAMNNEKIVGFKINHSTEE